MTKDIRVQGLAAGAEARRKLRTLFTCSYPDGLSSEIPFHHHYFALAYPYQKEKAFYLVYSGLLFLSNVAKGLSQITHNCASFCCFLVFKSCFPH